MIPLTIHSEFQSRSTAADVIEHVNLRGKRAIVTGAGIGGQVFYAAVWEQR